MAEPQITNDPNLWVGEILKAARLRTRMTPSQLGVVLGFKSDGRMVRLWEIDKREIGGHSTTLEKVLEVYRLTDEEKREVVKRISLRRQQVLAKKLDVLGKGSLTPPQNGVVLENVPVEIAVLNQLMTLSPEKRKWVIKTAQEHDSLA